ncbi:uncharacterized protein M421DRAFT_303827 [Didymella exigua CBS 183.55]|uniref:Uncharacterized protein n=1 Tax=Didymella exigua CBS 183.55 TaxID=1150837 RepID=A0A6A5RA20_9PLEO|nr:uncharacterized protein M421DRAFT_303827 [Didymella exigua CBS 183.55]KAF1923884.1 hypothetical protein M421DRAFT_303827 [Didymella exigua CBS 183.55]
MATLRLMAVKTASINTICSFRAYKVQASRSAWQLKSCEMPSPLAEHKKKMCKSETFGKDNLQSEPQSSTPKLKTLPKQRVQALVHKYRTWSALCYNVAKTTWLRHWLFSMQDASRSRTLQERCFCTPTAQICRRCKNNLRDCVATSRLCRTRTKSLSIRP